MIREESLSMFQPLLRIPCESSFPSSLSLSLFLLSLFHGEFPRCTSYHVRAKPWASFPTTIPVLLSFLSASQDMTGDASILLIRVQGKITSRCLPLYRFSFPVSFDFQETGESSRLTLQLHGT